MKVLITPEAIEYFNELSTTLYEKEYFGFEENAVKYVNELLDDIIETLSRRVKKPAPAYFDKYGRKMLYAVFPKNKRTQWYVFFSVYEHQGEIIYLVRYISNNHVSAPYL